MSIQSAELGEQFVAEAPDWEIIGSEEQKGEHGDVVGAFRERFRTAIQAGIHTIDINSLKHYIKNPDKSVELQLSRAVECRTGDGVYLSPEYQWLEGAGFVNFHARRTSGPKTSSHGVFFGVLHEKPDDISNAIAVAVKPCIDKPVTAIEDWVGNSLAHQIDDRGYEPIGFFSNGEVAYSITRFDPEGFDTLDKTPWVNAARYIGDPEYAEQQEIVKLIGGSLAELHDQQVYHGDPQFKNIVHDISGETHFIDWESARFYDNPPSEKIIASKIEHDFRVLFGSMARGINNKGGVGLLEKKTPSAQWEVFQKLVLRPYEQAYVYDLAKDNEAEQEKRMEVLGEVEHRLHEYVINEGLRTSLGQARNQE